MLNLLQTVGSSDYHPQLVIGASDGTCMTANSLRSIRKGGIVSVESDIRIFLTVHSRCLHTKSTNWIITEILRSIVCWNDFFHRYIYRYLCLLRAHRLKGNTRSTLRHPCKIERSKFASEACGDWSMVTQGGNTLRRVEQWEWDFQRALTCLSHRLWALQGGLVIGTVVPR